MKAIRRAYTSDIRRKFQRTGASFITNNRALIAHYWISLTLAKTALALAHAILYESQVTLMNKKWNYHGISR